MPWRLTDPVDAYVADRRTFAHMIAAEPCDISSIRPFFFPFRSDRHNNTILGHAPHRARRMVFVPVASDPWVGQMRPLLCDARPEVFLTALDILERE